MFAHVTIQISIYLMGSVPFYTLLESYSISTKDIQRTKMVLFSKCHVSECMDCTFQMLNQFCREIIYLQVSNPP